MLTWNRKLPIYAAAVLTLAIATGAAGAQRGRGAGMMHDDPAQQADMQMFHALLDHRTEITRTVTLMPNGIETLTESDNPEVTKILQAHVASMLARVEEARPIHRRDPLFAEIFRNANKIEASSTLTPKGVRVVETSTDPYVATLLQEHAKVLDAFLANGYPEVRKNHPVPERKGGVQ